MQDANTRRLFLKLCWLMGKRAVSAHRVTKIDETSCRLLPVQTIGWCRRGVKQAQLQGNTKRGHDIHSRPQHGSWRLGHVGASHSRWQDRRRLASATVAAAHSPRHIGERAGQPRRRSCSSRPSRGRRDDPGQRTTIVDLSLGHGQHPPQQGHQGRHAGDHPSFRYALHPTAQQFVFAALWCNRLPQLQELHPGASEHHSCPLRHRRLVRRHRDEQGTATTVID